MRVAGGSKLLPGLAITALVVLSLAALGAGGLPGGLDALLQRESPATTILWQLRLPRLTLGLSAGALLAGAGMILQAVLRNPLADPGVLGLNAGASLAVVALILVGRNAHSPQLTALAALGGALMAALLVRWVAGMAEPLRLVMAGIGVSAIAGAATTVIGLRAEGAGVQVALRWSLGSLNGTTGQEAALLLLALVLSVPLLLLARPALDVAALDTASATGLGLPPSRSFQQYGLLAVAMAATATAMAGPIAFVGLAAPHLARRLVGPRHTAAMPLALILGAGLVVAADLTGRLAFAPIQLPAGLVSALIGAPFFLWLMWSSHAR